MKFWNETPTNLTTFSFLQMYNNEMGDLFIAFFYLNTANEISVIIFVPWYEYNKK